MICIFWGFLIDSYTTAGETDPFTTSYKVGKLHEGTDYLFKVVAENKIGSGPPAELPDAITAKLPFGEFI